MTSDAEFDTPTPFTVGDRVRVTLTIEVVSTGTVASVNEQGMPQDVEVDHLDPDTLDDITVVGLVVHGRAD